MTVHAAASVAGPRRGLLLCLLVAIGSAAAAANRSEGAPGGPTTGAARAPAPAAAQAPAGAVEPGVDAPGVAVSVAAHPQLANAGTIALRHSDEGLRKTYLDRRGRRKDGMQLPRIIVFNAQGRLLGGQAGFRTGDMRHLRRLVHDDRPFPRAASLDDTLAELETPAGEAVQQAGLPAADVYLVVYRSADCERCDRLEAELAVVVGGLYRHRFAWLVVDSDPGRLDAASAPAPVASR